MTEIFTNEEMKEAADYLECGFRSSYFRDFLGKSISVTRSHLYNGLATI
jgi:hypothetical protein